VLPQKDIDVANYSFIFFLLIGLGAVQAQEIHLDITCNGSSIGLHRPIPLSEGGSIQVDKLKFYLRDSHANKMYLVDLEKDTNYTLLKVEGTVHLELGTDSLINVSGVLSGPFDPLEGMYWAWNSGYINFKCEGKYTDTQAVVHPFSYHLGGYQDPFQTHRSLSLKSNAAAEHCELALDSWFLHMFSQVGFNLMSPGLAAVNAMDVLSLGFNLAHEK